MNQFSEEYVSKNTKMNRGKGTKKIFKDRKNEYHEYDPILKLFKEYLELSNYSAVIDHVIRVQLFIKILNSNGRKFQVLNDYKRFNQTDITEYENYLRMRINNGEITIPTSYVYLLSIKHFCNFLSYKNFTNIEYTIPKEFRGWSKRTNEYIDVDDIIKFILSVNANDSDIKLRNLSIILLILDTGCRPIEICNLNINDLKLSERTIIIRSKKSGQRKMSINPKLAKMLKSYLETREMYMPSCDSLFLRINGSRISRISITRLFTQESKKAFGRSYITAKALRHTYATNAIDNNDNRISEISASMGHKHLKSTIYYLNRNHKRLLKNTLQYNPFGNKDGDI
ncbi:tyrosine-type recombinase/integrase [Fredinandcohnia humi]